MHPEAFDYANRQIRKYRSRFQQVVEYGSRDVNGSVRPLFTDTRHYWGIDLREGKGVNEIGDAVYFDGDQSYDCVICTEMLEDASEPWQVLQSAKWALRPGGMLIATMAAPERDPHSNDGDTELAPGEHYRGIAESELRDWLAHGWQILNLEYHPGRGDLYVTAQKEGK